MGCVAVADAADVTKAYPCIYPFPQNGEVVEDNIVTVLPKNPPLGGAYTLYDGHIATLNGRYPATTHGVSTTSNNGYKILIKEHPDRPEECYVGHLTLGGNLQFCETDVSIHGQTPLPTRVNVFTEFLPYTRLNLSGSLLADLSNMPVSGLKIYSAGASFSNALCVIGSTMNSHGGFVNVEIAAPSLVYNNFSLPIGYGLGHELCMYAAGNTEGEVEDIHGALIYHARTGHSVENDEGEDSLYAPFTCMGDLVGGGEHHRRPEDCLTNNIVFYSKWDTKADTLEAKYNIPDENTPIFISNSLKLVWTEVEVFAVEKPAAHDMRPMPVDYKFRYRRLSGDARKGQIHATLHPDGRVYSYFTLDNKPIPYPLKDAVKVSHTMLYTPDAILLLEHGGTIDMRKCGPDLSLFNITAGSVTYGGGKVLVKPDQLITLDGHRTIRHEIHGYADMDITGKADAPINICFERLLQPHKDHRQARFELNAINVNHARVYIGPGNVVAGQPHAKDAGFFCHDNVELFNYGVITRDILVKSTSRVVNSHYAKTEILKHNCVCCSPWPNHFMDIPLDQYPGTIHGDVVLEPGAEFCNYGEVYGSIIVGQNAVLYGCGTCRGRVTVLPGGVLYFDHGAHISPSATGYFWQIHNDTNIKNPDGTVKPRPDGSLKELVLHKNALLAFRVAAPKVNPCPNVLIIEGRVEVKHKIPVRLDIDGSIVDLLPQDGSTGRVKLLQAVHPGRTKGMNRLEMHISSGADLVEHPKLIWEGREGALYFEARLSRKSADDRARKTRTNGRRRSR